MASEFDALMFGGDEGTTQRDSPRMHGEHAGTAYADTDAGVLRVRCV